MPDRLSVAPTDKLENKQKEGNQIRKNIRSGIVRDADVFWVLCVEVVFLSKALNVLNKGAQPKLNRASGIRIGVPPLVSSCSLLCAVRNLVVAARILLRVDCGLV